MNEFFNNNNKVPNFGQLWTENPFLFYTKEDLNYYLRT